MRDSLAMGKAPWAVNGFGSTFFHKKVEEKNGSFSLSLFGAQKATKKAVTIKGALPCASYPGPLAGFHPPLRFGLRGPPRAENRAKRGNRNIAT